MEESKHIGKEIPPGKIYLLVSPLRTIVCSRKEKRANTIDQQTGGNFRPEGYVEKIEKCPFDDKREHIHFVEKVEFKLKNLHRLYEIDEICNQKQGDQ